MDSVDRFVEFAAMPIRRDASRRRPAVCRRLAIVDPSRLRRDCLKLALGAQARRWQVIDVATAVELVRLVERGEVFAVILLCGPTASRVSLGDIDLLLRAAPRTPVLVAADCDDRRRAHALLRAGARGFLPTNLSLKVLLAVLDRVRTGSTYMPLVLSEPESADDPSDPTSAPWSELTGRQREVLALISQGLSNRLIAATLTTTENTIKAHVKGIIRRLNVANRTQAALLAARRGGSPPQSSSAIVTA